MKKKIFITFSVVVILSLILPASVAGQVPEPKPEVNRPQRNQMAKEVPQEIRDKFKDGVPVEEFLAEIKGPIPNALLPYAKQKIAVIVELPQAPLAAMFATAKREGKVMPAANQQAYLQSLKAAQAPIVNSLRAMGGTVISQYQKAYNGILVYIEAAKLPEIRALPGVKSVRRAPMYYADLQTSVPLINADDVWADLGYTGDGVTIAVIDTGIDYTHAALGGSGDPDDYANNDPNVVEFGTFPTPKVIGGYDFAGTNYDASGEVGSPIPTPDADPLDENSHGTHVASIAAGIGSSEVAPGVAPDALLYALKVFGAEGSTNLVVDAIEWAMDPNGDGNLSDHVDVINMSLGAYYGPADPANPDIVASDMASAIGIVVVAAAGNRGDVSYIVDSPSTADSAISVAASTTGWDYGPTVNISGTSYITLTNIIYMPPAFDNNTGHFITETVADLYYVGNIPGAPNDLLCSTTGLPAGVLNDQLALIQRGGCNFSTKVNNAAALGAVGAIIFNHTTGGDALVTMVGTPVAIPAGFVGHTNGVNLSTAHGQTAVVSAETDRTLVPSAIPADTIADFSSRGPRGFDSYLKPEITAPGVAIFAAAMGTGYDGVSYSGTSMATPHIAGVAALLKEEYPDWTPEMIKAVMMNTAVDLADDTSSQVPRQGAGRVDAYAAAIANSVAIGDADLVSLSWGFFTTNDMVYTNTKTIEVMNTSSSDQYYDVGWYFHPDSLTSGFTLVITPTNFGLSAGGSQTVDVTMVITPSEVIHDYFWLEEYYGFVEISYSGVVLAPEENGSSYLRVPFYAVPRPYSVFDITGFGIVDYEEWIEIDQYGPTYSLMWVYPAFVVDRNEVLQGDEGDLHLVGMDYGWYDDDYGDIIVPAFNTYGSFHTPQPYFAEFDLIIDADGDGYDDFVDFNFNYGWLATGRDDDTWVVLQVDLSSMMLYLASPYLNTTDYNNGYQEWYLPTEWQVLTSGDTDFNFYAVSWDYEGNMDDGGGWYFDAYRPPIWWGATGFWFDPGDTEFVLYGLWDMAGYLMSKPSGLMIVDYYGMPGYDGLGAFGQAYYYPFEFTFIQWFFPYMFLGSVP